MIGHFAAVLALFAPTPVPRLVVEDNPIALIGPARPAAYMEASGRRAAFVGREDGTFEAWVYPLKILHDFELSFSIARYAEPIPGGRLATSVDIRPASSTVRYTHDAFTVDASWFVPLDASGGLVLLDIDASEAVTIGAQFRTDLKPMWPAGLGGQYSYWHDELRAYVITESTGRHAAIVGSPLASEPPRQPAHNLPDAPTSFRIPVDSDTARSGLVPIVIAASVEGLSEARRTYERLLSSTEALYGETVDHYRRLRLERTRIDSPDDDLDLAFEWGKIALDKGFVCNPQLGCGLVAGLGPSGRSERPGFGWFFGGDAFMNMWAISAYGDYETVARSLAFLAERQRADGKMMHELSQGAAYIDWFEDFPYGYYHADTTPLYLVAVRDYLRASGDVSLVDTLWPSLQRAYDYCLSTDENGDGLMDNSLAGLAAVETGALRSDELLTDVYLASAWTEAAGAMEELAAAVGEPRMAESAGAAYRKARAALNATFLDDDTRRIHFALMQDGHAQGEVTVWPAFGLWRGLFDSERPAVGGALDALASSSLGTDWGARMLSRESALYDHASYNNGAVWPFVSGFAALALYENGREEAAWSYVDGMKDLTLLGDRGFIPELVSGDRLRAVEAAVPHQLFASAGFVSSLLRGLVGLGGESLRPRIPAGWNFLRVENLRFRDALYDFDWRRGESPRLTPQLADSDPVPTLRMASQPAVRIFPVRATPREGSRSVGLRILETTLAKPRFTARLQGRSGHTYRIEIDSVYTVESVVGGRRVDGGLEVSFPASSGEWSYLELTLQLTGGPR